VLLHATGGSDAYPNLAKRVFMVNRGRYRVSQHGRSHLRQLLGPVVPE
jgi:hypothetical protein